MATELTVTAIEESTYIITAAFTDEDEAAVTPNAGLNWTLTDRDGNIINSRDSVSLTPGTSVNVVLSGDDLALPGDDRVRIFTVEGTYDSDLDTDLPLKAACQFTIEDLTAVT